MKLIIKEYSIYRHIVIHLIFMNLKLFNKLVFWILYFLIIIQIINVTFIRKYPKLIIIWSSYKKYNMMILCLKMYEYINQYQ